MVAMGTLLVFAATTVMPFSSVASPSVGATTSGDGPGPGTGSRSPSGRTASGSPVAGGRVRKVGKGAGLAYTDRSSSPCS